MPNPLTDGFDVSFFLPEFDDFDDFQAIKIVPSIPVVTRHQTGKSVSPSEARNSTPNVTYIWP